MQIKQLCQELHWGYPVSGKELQCETLNFKSDLMILSVGLAQLARQHSTGLRNYGIRRITFALFFQVVKEVLKIIPSIWFQIKIKSQTCNHTMTGLFFASFSAGKNQKNNCEFSCTVKNPE